MRILAIETSTRDGEVAALQDSTLLASQTVPKSARLTAGLLPAIDHLLQKVGWSPKQLELVAVDIGPGSFMGTRIGLTAAKTIAYTVGCELIPVVSVDVVARAIPTTAAERLQVGFDAARGEVFAGTFVPSNGRWKRTDLTIVPLKNWLTTATEQTLLAGPIVLQDIPDLPVQRLAPRELCRPRAEFVGRLALEQYRPGTQTDYWVLEPLYLRPSAAEEKLARKQSPQGPGAAC